MNQQTNVLGSPLKECGSRPLTGYLRDGYCCACGGDRGQHVVCASITEEFLQYSKEQGNDLITPRPEFNFPGLVAGNRWCVCTLRWLEALKAGCAPPVHLEGTHLSVLEYVDLELLRKHAAQ
jgi:uncharacterized protein